MRDGTIWYWERSQKNRNEAISKVTNQQCDTANETIRPIDIGSSPAKSTSEALLSMPLILSAFP